MIHLKRPSNSFVGEKKSNSFVYASVLVVVYLITESKPACAQTLKWPQGFFFVFLFCSCCFGFLHLYFSLDPRFASVFRVLISMPSEKIVQVLCFK